MPYSCPVCGKAFGTELPAARHVLNTSDPDHRAWRTEHDEVEQDADRAVNAVKAVWD